LQAAHQSKLIKPPSILQSSNQSPSINSQSFFSESFISSGKQGGGATVPREGCDIVTRENCIATPFSEHKQLKKNSCAAFCLHPFCGWGHAKLSLQIIEHNCAYVKFS
jgi:hypothetical protein